MNDMTGLMLEVEQRVREFTGEPLIIDSFAGGGGASTGIEMALGRSPDIAINHDPIALSMHEANHPKTKHLTTSIYAIDPRDLVKPGQRVGLLWASPDCTHHSKAKGGKPLKKNIRDLAWVVVHHAEMIQPEIIMLENVEEFQDWCPLKDGRPDQTRKGETFMKWVKALRALGYKVEWRTLKASDYGAPTIRKRLFVIARRDRKPIIWPAPTHKKKNDIAVIHGQSPRIRTAADIIDWSLPCPSIFDTSEEIMEKFGLRAVRPLADNTMRRIARGVMRYVIEAKNPFIVRAEQAYAPFVSYAQHGGRSRPVGLPLHTITASLKDQNTLISPALVNVANSKTTGRGPNVWDIEEPIRTLTTSPGFAVMAPTLVQTGYGEAPGQKPRCLDINEPLGTIVAGGGKHAFVAPHLMTMRNAGKPFSAGNEPTHTLTAGGAHMMAVSAFLAQHNGGPRMQTGAGRSADQPLSTLTTRGTQQNIIAASMFNLRGTKDGQLNGLPIDQAVPTISAGGGHAGIIAAFLHKYYGTEQDPRIDEPLHTLTTKERFGLVTVHIDGEEYAIVDIGMRMLTPREQFRAQGFPENYIIDRGADGKPMAKTQQTHKCGNSVCPPVVAALVGANAPHLRRS